MHPKRAEMNPSVSWAVGPGLPEQPHGWEGGRLSLQKANTLFKFWYNGPWITGSMLYCSQAAAQEQTNHLTFLRTQAPFLYVQSDLGQVRRAEPALEDGGIPSATGHFLSSL